MPILDPSDSNALGSFFNHLSNWQPNDWTMPLYGNSLAINENLFNSVAPDLLGHSTSFGPHPPLDLASAAMPGQSPVNYQDGFPFIPNMPNTIPQPQPLPELHLQPHLQPTPTRSHQHRQSFQDGRNLQRMAEQNAHTDAAASLTTLQSGHAYAYSPAMSSINNVQHSPVSQPPRSYRNSLSQSHTLQGHDPFIRPARTNEPDTLFRDMMFGTESPTTQRTAERLELQWGSDSLFARSQRFVPPQHESSEALEKKRMVAMSGALTVASSNPNTRASSPLIHDEMAIPTIPEGANRNTKVQGNPATSHKKRKSKLKLEEEEEKEEEENKVPLPPKPTTKKRKSGVELKDLPGSSLTQEAAGKRRKSGPSQSKPPRENLTEAQKRENHIKSEQKRRLAIKEGFEDLAFIIPNLQNGGYSKSNTLSIAGEWIQSLVDGNRKLEQLLSKSNVQEAEDEANEVNAP